MSALTLKLFGSGLLTLCGALVGWRGAASLRERAGRMRAISAALGVLSGELTALRTPLPQIFARLRGEPFFALLDAGFGTAPTETLWRRAASEMDLAESPAAALASLGAVVGRYDAARQAAEIAAVRAVLDESARSAERELAVRGRRLPGLGAALGAMAAALLF